MGMEDTNEMTQMFNDMDMGMNTGMDVDEDENGEVGGKTSSGEKISKLEVE